MLRGGRRLLTSQTICQGVGMVHPVWVVMVEEVLLIFLDLDCFQPLTLWDYRVPVIKVSLTEGTWLFHFGLLRVARYSFSGSMPPKFDMSINYVSINKDLEKLSPQLY